METDKELFRIFRPNPELFAEFLLLDKKGPCTLRSETLKSLERRVDCVLEFEQRDTVVFVEIQGYEDITVYARLIAAMAQYHIEYPLRFVQGVIVFIKPEHDPCTYPWKMFAECGQPPLRVLYLEEVLASLAERDPNHVLLSVFTPLTCRSKAELKKIAGRHYHRLRQANITPAGKEGLLEAFESWLIARFKNRAEVREMIVDIPPIEKSAAAKYFREQGQEIGVKLGEKRGIKRGEKLGEKRGEIKAIRQQISRLKKHRKGMPPETFRELMSSLETRLAQLSDTK